MSILLWRKILLNELKGILHIVNFIKYLELQVILIYFIVLDISQYSKKKIASKMCFIYRQIFIKL